MVLKKCLVCDLVPFSVFKYGSYYIPAGVIGLRSVVELSLSTRHGDPNMSSMSKDCVWLRLPCLIIKRMDSGYTAADY